MPQLARLTGNPGTLRGLYIIDIWMNRPLAFYRGPIALPLIRVKSGITVESSS